MNYYTPLGTSTCQTLYVTEINVHVQTFCFSVCSLTRLLNSIIHLTANCRVGNTTYHLYGDCSGSDIGKR
jgi:hypothetical protein